MRIEAVLLAVWGAVAVLSAQREWVSTTEIAGFIVAYFFSMLLLSPDLDLAKSDTYRRWGPLRWLWAPYAAAFRHRLISHHPLFGPITRIGYVGVLVLAALAICRLAGLRVAPQLVLPTGLAFAVLMGLYLPNLTHIVVDGIQSVWFRLRGRL